MSPDRVIWALLFARPPTKGMLTSALTTPGIGGLVPERRRCFHVGGARTYGRETGANNSGRPTARFEPPAPTPSVGIGLESQTVGTEMNNSPYLDKPLIPLAVALRSMLAETEAKITTAPPAEKIAAPTEGRNTA